MKIAHLIILGIFLLSCTTKSKTVPSNSIKKNDDFINEDTTTKLMHLIINEIGKLNEDSCYIHWYSGGIFSLCFEKEEVKFFFTPQCIYRYKTRLDKNRLIFYWGYDSDCVFDRGLEKDMGAKKQPIAGEPFGEFVLVNDTTLSVKYYYPEWVRKVNEHQNDIDTLFPTVFRMKTR